MVDLTIEYFAEKIDNICPTIYVYVFLLEVISCFNSGISLGCLGWLPWILVCTQNELTLRFPQWQTLTLVDKNLVKFFQWVCTKTLHSTIHIRRYRIASALSLDTRGARWEEFSREKENYRQRSVQQQFNNGDFLERMGTVRD
jgi:hypothetical protein